MKKKINRVQLNMSEESLCFLNHLKEKTNSSSRAEVIKNAIITYDLLVERTLNKDEILIRNSEGVVTILALPIIVRK